MPQSAARQGVASPPPAFDQWWGGYENTASAFLFDEASKIVAQAAWLAAIRYAEHNIGLDKR